MMESWGGYIACFVILYLIARLSVVVIAAW